VFEALKNEAVKRGFKEGVYIKTTHGNIKKISGVLKNGVLSELVSFNDPDRFNGSIFRNGNWAEIIPTIAKEEAEKQLGIKIID